MKILVTKNGVNKVLHLFPETYQEQSAFQDFHDPTKPCTVEFKADSAYTYPHIEIRKEVL